MFIGRRKFAAYPGLRFVLVAVITGTIAMACGGDGKNTATPAPTPTPFPTVSVFAEPHFRPRAVAIVDAFLSTSGQDVNVTEASDPVGADVTITASGPSTAPAFASEYWVPVAALPNRAEGLTMAQLGDAVAGALTDWTPITGRRQPLNIVLPSDRQPPLEQWWPGIVVGPRVVTLPLADIPAALKADPGALALMPLSAVDVQVRSLNVDDMNIVFGHGAADTYPLVERRSVVVRPAENSEFSSLLQGAAARLAADLPARPDPIIIKSTGDLGLVRCTYAKQRDYGDFRRAFMEVGPWLADADTTTGSSDFTISDAGEPYGCIETFNLLAPPQTVEGYQYAGFDVVTIAANHVKDCGQTGYCGNEPFFDTMEYLHAAGVMTVGGGKNLTEARRPGVIEVKGVRFAFLGYDEIGYYNFAEDDYPGTAPLAPDFLREDIAAAKKIADVIVVMPQWGVEYTADPTLQQRELAEVAVEAGADLVVGNGAHWVAATEVIDDAFVTYALGNFVYDQDWSLPTQQGAVLESVFHGARLKGIRLHPTRILDRHLVTFPPAAEAEQILDQIWDASALLD